MGFLEIYAMIEKKFFCLKALVLGWKNNNKKYAPRLALLLVLCDQNMLECFSLLMASVSPRVPLFYSTVIPAKVINNW